MPKDSGELLLEAITPDYGIWLRGKRLGSEQTAFQKLEMLRSESLGTFFRLDGYNMAAEGDEFIYHEMFNHPALLVQSAPRRALILGGGDGGSAREILKHPSIESVTLVEIDAAVVRVARERLAAVCSGAFDDLRLRLEIADARDWVHRCPADERFDAIMLDLNDPLGPAAALYQREFLRCLSELLTPAGCLVLHGGHAFFHQQRLLGHWQDLRALWPLVRLYTAPLPLYGGAWSFLIASRQSDPLALGAAQWHERIAERGLTQLRYLNAACLQAAFALPNYLRALLTLEIA